MQLHDDPVTIVTIKFEFEFPSTLSDAEVKARAKQMVIDRVHQKTLPNPWVTRLPETYTIYCNKCGMRMIISLDKSEEEIECPLAGCGMPTGIHGYMHAAGGREEHDPGRKMR